MPNPTNNKEPGISKNVATAFNKCHFDSLDLFLRKRACWVYIDRRIFVSYF